MISLENYNKHRDWRMNCLRQIRKTYSPRVKPSERPRDYVEKAHLYEDATEEMRFIKQFDKFIIPLLELD